MYWTPNGDHRRAVLDKLKADSVPAILVVEREAVFEVLPLNVEKAPGDLNGRFLEHRGLGVAGHCGDG